MSKTSPVQKETAGPMVPQLVEMGELDTLYRDLYLEKARELMEPVMSNASYSYVKDSMSSLGLIEQQLRGAVQRGDWARTTELTERVKSIKKLADRRDTIDLAESVYDKLSSVPIDPFAPGFNAFFNRSSDALEELRKRAISLLSSLETGDPGDKDFYEGRRADFESLTIGKQEEKKKEEQQTVSEVDLRTAALNAVDAGDLSQLDLVLEKLKTQKTETKTEGSVAVELGAEAKLGDDLLYTFTEETLAAAARFGLAPAKTTSRRHFSYLVPYEWHPSFLKSESKKWAKDQMSHLTHATETTDKMREAMELYLFNPFINSGGTRYHVCLVVEDLLMENFDEPEPLAQMPKTELLEALELRYRWGLTRIDIENALVKHGPQIVRDINLDPEDFKLIAIPADIYTNLASERGWGQKEFWTHFDGYWVREGGNLQALAGGDTRFGGSHDVVCFSSNYTSDKVFARFAIVQRKRMMSWHRK